MVSANGPSVVRVFPSRTRTVVAWEVVVGLLAGVYVLARGLIAPGVALAALVPPPVIIVTGRIALRAARRERPGGPS